MALLLGSAHPRSVRDAGSTPAWASGPLPQSGRGNRLRSGECTGSNPVRATSQFLGVYPNWQRERFQKPSSVGSNPTVPTNAPIPQSGRGTGSRGQVLLVRVQLGAPLPPCSLDETAPPKGCTRRFDSCHGDYPAGRKANETLAYGATGRRGRFLNARL